MADIDAVREAIDSLGVILDGVDPEFRRKIPDRSVSAWIKDLDVAFSGRLQSGELVGITEIDPSERKAADLELTLSSDDLIELVDGRLHFGSGWAQGPDQGRRPPPRRARAAQVPLTASRRRSRQRRERGRDVVGPATRRRPSVVGSASPASAATHARRHPARSPPSPSSCRVARSREHERRRRGEQPAQVRREVGRTTVRLGAQQRRPRR